MKSASTKQKSTASVASRIGTKNMKPKSRTTTKAVKVESTKGAKHIGRASGRKTSLETDQTSRKAFKQQKGKSKSYRHTKAPPTTSKSSSPQTPERKVRSPSSHSTPSTAASSMSSPSKRAVSMMSDLALNSPPKKGRNTPEKQGSDDFNDASEFDWLNLSVIDDALVHHGEELEELNKFDYHDKIVLLCTYFKPNDIRPVFQGIYQDAGKNWRDLKLTKHKTMKTLSADFANACVDIYNARLDLNVPQKITIKQEPRDKISKA